MKRLISMLPIGSDSATRQLTLSTERRCGLTQSFENRLFSPLIARVGAFAFILLFFCPLAPQPAWGAADDLNLLIYRQHGRPSYFELPRQPVDINRPPLPGLVSRSPVKAVEVPTIYPHDGFVVPRNGQVTFGWLPLEAEFFQHFALSVPSVVRSYRLEIQREDRYFESYQFLARDHRRQYSMLFNPPAPGRYRWWIRAVFDNNYEVPSVTRYFVVLPQ